MGKETAPTVEMVTDSVRMHHLSVLPYGMDTGTMFRIRMDVHPCRTMQFHYGENNNNMGRKMKTIRIIFGKSIVMYDVNSSNIYRVGYDSSKMELYVEFLDGSLYRYSNVPADLWTMFMAAKSKGSFLHFFVKINDYDYDEVTGSVETEDGGSIASIGGDPGTEHPDGYIVMK